MFINTRAVGKKIVNDVKLFSAVYSILVQLLYVAFLVYTLFSGCGIIGLNVTLLTLSVLFEGFLIYSFFNGDFLTREDTIKIKHAYRIASLVIRGISLGIAVYGIHIALSEVNTVSLLFSTFMLFGWISGALIEIVKFVIERYIALLTSAFSKDTEPFVRVYRKITFKGYEEREARKADAIVDEITAEYKDELKDKRDSQKALKEAERLIEKEQRRTEIKKRMTDAKEKVKSIFKKKNDE